MLLRLEEGVAEHEPTWKKLDPQVDKRWALSNSGAHTQHACLRVVCLKPLHLMAPHVQCEEFRGSLVYMANQIPTPKRKT